jgi:hypothetical protein
LKKENVLAKSSIAIQQNFERLAVELHDGMHTLLQQCKAVCSNVGPRYFIEAQFLGLIAKNTQLQKNLATRIVKLKKVVESFQIVYNNK